MNLQKIYKNRAGCHSCHGCPTSRVGPCPGATRPTSREWRSRAKRDAQRSSKATFRAETSSVRMLRDLRGCNVVGDVVCLMPSKDAPNQITTDERDGGDVRDRLPDRRP